MRPEGVELVVPRGMPLQRADSFVQEKRPWIERNLRRLREAEAQAPAARLENGGWVPYLGERLELVVREEHGRVRAHVGRRGGTLRVALPTVEPDALRRAVEGWYRRRARIEVQARLDAATRRAGSRHTGLSIRGQRTRWASCSSSGAMSFNWRLLLAPDPVLEYVVEHEVVHLEVLDHSPRFWRLLRSRCPAYREHERWLRRHGPALRL